MSKYCKVIFGTDSRRQSLHSTVIVIFAFKRKNVVLLLVLPSYPKINNEYNYYVKSKYQESSLMLRKYIESNDKKS